MRDYIQKVEAELIKGDKNAGELKDATKLAYPEIFSAIAELSKQERVEHYFTYVSPLPTLTYHLKRVPFWQIPKSA